MRPLSKPEIVINDLQSDPVEKTGCSNLNDAVLLCYAEMKDWRKCQKELEEFKKCMESYEKNRINKLE